MGRETWRAKSMGSQRVGQDLATKHIGRGDGPPVSARPGQSLALAGTLQDLDEYIVVFSPSSHEDPENGNTE